MNYMKPTLILLIAFISLSIISCKNTTEKGTEPMVPAETRSTIEYNQNQLDTIPEDKTNRNSFVGIGTEPFWRIEIKDDTILFESPEEKITSTISKSDISTNSSRYTSNFEDGIMKIKLNKENCSDGMSDIEHSHKVELQIKRPGDKDFEKYSGCGSYKEI